MATTEQESLNSFTAGTNTEQVAQTVILDLETSDAKNRKIQTAIGEYHAMCKHLGDHMPAISSRERSAKNPALYRILTREFPGPSREVHSSVVLAATHKVAGAYESRSQRGSGARPQFGGGNYFGLQASEIAIEENDKGYGLKASFVPYKPEWFHVDPSPYQREYLERICDEDDDASYGTAEFRLKDDGSLYCHLPVKWNVDVYEPADVTTTVGVDLGENVIYAAAVVTSEGVEDAEIKPGKEFRHYRNQLDQKRKRLSQQGDLNGVRACRGERRKYTEQVLDTASREIVDMAVDHRPAVIALEDLTGYRETAENPIHDWPYAMLQEKIMYKATAEGIPVETVNARNTSKICRKCPGDHPHPEYRDGTEFKCRRCGYEVHADLNAAINIAGRRETLDGELL